ncbi:hypothetical protein [Lactiplantibacillus herbarum]|uniref:hypothetical protein n=1 Tax=Lactiplantibacillus herbarum TaxID=1670446 RepID=UPI00069F2595|nr:hypothetical protein [Lactiplantibacillus herbarum]
MKKAKEKRLFEVLVTSIILILAIISLQPTSLEHLKTQLNHGSLVYASENLRKRSTGKGHLKVKNKNHYIGRFKDGRFEGKGQFVSHAGWQLKGTFKNGEPTGKVQLRVDKKPITPKISKK